MYAQYVQASITEVLEVAYPKRYVYTENSSTDPRLNPLWEVEYIAWASAYEFVTSLPMFLEDSGVGNYVTFSPEQLKATKHQFAEAVMNAVKQKMARKDVV